METVILAIMVGFLGGLITWDLRQRTITGNGMKAAEDELKKNAATLADLHNKAAAENIDLRNRLESLELALKSVSNGKNAMVKRF